MTLPVRGGSDFGPPAIAPAIEPEDRNKAIVVVAEYAKDLDELRTFLQMLGLVDELV